MIFTETKLKGAFIIDVTRREDERGFFARSFCKKEFKEVGLNAEICQCNISYNKKRGTLRGMHMQVSPCQEEKIIRCSRGSIYDVIIDMRKYSETYKHWVAVELDEKSYTMLYVPKDFAHGFITLENDTEVLYQITQYYTQGMEAGYKWNDPAFNIQWPVNPCVISEKDLSYSLL